MNLLSSSTNSIIRALTSTSEGIKKKDEICDIPWISIDDDQKLQKLIFRRGSELISSINGVVQKGKWTNISETGSFLIETSELSLLFKEPYSDKNIFIMKLDSLQEEYFCFVNEKTLPRLDFTKYLERKSNTDSVLKRIDLFDGGQLCILQPKTSKEKSGTYLKGLIISKEGQAVQGFTGVLHSESRRYMYHLKEGFVYKKSLFNPINLVSGGPIEIEGGNNTFESFQYNLGRKVFKNWKPLPDGEYFTHYNIAFKVSNGKVSFVGHRVRYKIKVGSDIWIEQQNPESVEIGDRIFDLEQNPFKGEVIINIKGRWNKTGDSTYVLSKRTMNFIAKESVISKKLSWFQRK